MTLPPRYDEWLHVVFGRIGDGGDPFAMNWSFDLRPGEMADLFIATMERSGNDLKPFTDYQVAIGLETLLFNSHAGVPHELTGGGVSEEQKVAVLGSLWPLYRDCLDRRSPPGLGHLNETGYDRLAYVTYMLWDVSTYDVMAKKTAARWETLMAVLSNALRLSNPACVESALHGLGHLAGSRRGFGAGARPEQARSVITDWLAEKPAVRPELLAYAASARDGCIQ